MKLPELLDQLRAAHYRGRIQIMLEIGRRAPQQPELAELLGQMSTRGFYLRHMALFAALSARDGAALERTALRDPSRILRRMAVHQSAGLCTDEQVLRLLDGLPGRERRLLVGCLLKRHRQPLVDQWLLGQGDPATEMLGFAGLTVLEKYRAQILERGAPFDWSRIARRHPDWAAAHVLQPHSGFAAVQLRAVLVELAEQRHPQTRELWERARAAGYSPNELPEDYIFHHFPSQQTGWALEHHEAPSLWSFQTYAHKLSLEQCRQCLERGWIHLEQSWWRRRPVEERQALFVEYRDQLVGGTGRIDPSWLDGVPHARRLPEALGQSQLAENQIEPRKLVEYLSMLGFEAGQAALLTLMQNPDVEVRSLGLRGFTRLGRYQADCRLAVLQTLTTRQNEADPVRAAFLEELANLPPAGWSPGHFKPLGEILKAALNAADASDYTFASVERLVLRILPFQPAWSAPWLAKLLRHRGQVSNYSWELYLQKPGSAEALDEELGAVLGEWSARERFPAIWALIRAVGDHLARLPQVVQRCVDLCDHPQAEAAQAALRMLSARELSVFPDLIPRLVQADPSWFHESVVRNFVHRHRQDLVDLALSENRMTGKFASGLTGWVMSFEGGFWRWTPDQQFRYSERLAVLLRDVQASFPTLRRCLRSLAQLPAVPPSLLQEYAVLSEERLAVRDEALRALARLDGGEGIPFLLGALEDDRGRVAIYALRGAFLALPVAAALERLLAITSPRITVQKEVVRLLGDLAGGVGLPFLLERLEKGGAHRDVYLASLRGLWEHLDDERVWPHLFTAAASLEEAVGQQLAVIPTGRHSALARERVNRLLLQLLHHASIRVRCAVMERLESQPVEDPEELLREPVLARLPQLGREGELAARVLRRKYAKDAEEWGRLVSEVAPARQALTHLLGAFRTYLLIYGAQPNLIRPHLLATIEVLRKDPAALVPWLELAAYRLPLAEFLEEVENQPPHWDIALNWVRMLSGRCFRLDRSHWQPIWERWHEHPQEHLRRLCLEALLLHTQAFGWNEESRERLIHFQADASPLVSGRAQFVFPPPITV